MIFLYGVAVGFVLCFMSLYALAVLRRRGSRVVHGANAKVRMREHTVAVVGHDDGRKTIIEGGS